MEMTIRPITREEVYESAVIFIESWRQDYDHLVPAKVLEGLDPQAEAAECAEWLYAECDDLRLIYAVFVDGKMAGYIAGSLVDDELEFDYDVEINGLFVRNEYRGQGLGLGLIASLLRTFQEQGYHSVLLYNWRGLASNEFYRRLGGEVVLEEIQNCGGNELQTDIFGWQLASLLATVEEKLTRYR